MKGVIVRSISGIVYIGIILAGLLINEALFRCFLLLFMALAVFEFTGLCNSRREHIFTVLLDVIGGALLILLVNSLMTMSPNPLWFAAGYVCYLILRLVLQLYVHSSSALNSLAFSFMGQTYIALPLALMSILYYKLGASIVLAMFVMIWLNDTGAFVVGSAIGRNKLFPRISPKKSWEGFFGGVIFAVASSFVFKYFFGEYFVMMDLWQLMLMGAVVGVFATWGDLVESMIKRTLGVKDSGNIIPGHGGILDRIDSLLLVVPALIVYFSFMLLLE